MAWRVVAFSTTATACRRKLTQVVSPRLMNMLLVSENRVVPLPAGVPLDIAVLFGCAVPTGAGIITNDIQPNCWRVAVAVFGLGGIGMSALMATMLFKCEKVVAVDVSADKLRWLVLLALRTQ